ncbi:hypothetical protein BGZ61DRAFT_469820 [Ilyonectria robusta]|uniref:uncharacterized protein n=1 Tax=Ilyonectria robusta TaxID=1079257 RepID=UPI001E8DA96B|nr:uncharacterized protein BGZ61DRAFT_469820 [Ilyonectria robusta]KAH8648094.1 hypothetical protein BGZ61DRAFT_469820 [Ilyonectria robusta]
MVPRNVVFAPTRVVLAMGPVFLFTLTRVISKAKRLGDKESELEEEFLKKRAALRAAQAEFDQSLDLLERARRQRQSLVTRGREMTRRGLESLEELEASEQAELEATIDLRSLVYADVIDWPSLGLSDGFAGAGSFLLDPSLPSSSGVDENPLGGVAHG